MIRPWYTSLPVTTSPARARRNGRTASTEPLWRAIAAARSITARFMIRGMALVAATISPSFTREWLWREAHMTSSTMLKAPTAAVFTCSRPSVPANRLIFPSRGSSLLDKGRRVLWPRMPAIHGKTSLQSPYLGVSSTSFTQPREAIMFGNPVVVSDNKTT